MYIVERIQTDPGNGEAVVFCGGQRFLITAADLARLGLTEGMEADPDELIESAERLSCIKKAFSLLAYSDMSAKRLKDKLAKNFPRDTADMVAELFTERGYLKDAELAGRYAADFYEAKLWGPRRIKSDLYTRGFNREDISSACQFLEQLDHRENIQKALRLKYRDPDLTDRGTRAKISAYLSRMGYSYEDINDVLSGEPE